MSPHGRRVYMLQQPGATGAVRVRRRKPTGPPADWLRRTEGAPAWWAGFFLALVVVFSWWGVLQWVTGPQILGVASALTAWAVALTGEARESRARRRPRRRGPRVVELSRRADHARHYRVTTEIRRLGSGQLLCRLNAMTVAGADLVGARLDGADLLKADLRGVQLQAATLRGADLGGANLADANLRGTDLRRAELGGARLHHADLTGADLRGARLHGADLSGIRHDPTTRWPAGFDLRAHDAALPSEVVPWIAPGGSGTEGTPSE